MSLIIPANTLAAGGYAVDNSVRFDGSSSFSISQGNTNRRTFTISAWVKRSDISGGAGIVLLNSYSSSSDYTSISLNNDGRLNVNSYLGGYPGGDDQCYIASNALYRDVGAWYHFCVGIDTTNGTTSERQKLWVNGERLTSFESSSNLFSQNAQTKINSGATAYIQKNQYGAAQKSSYMSEVCFIDGQQLDADQFAEYDEDSGIWKPIDVSGLTFGTNGFYLEFKQSGTSQNSSGLGADTSGEDNHLAVSNLTAIDQSTDTCTNNFATLNPLVKPAAAITLSEGNLKGVFPGSWTALPATFGLTKGKWYFEAKNITSGQNAFIGVVTENQDWDDSTPYNETTGVVLYGPGGRKVVDNTNTEGFFATLSSGQIVGVALDLDSGTKTIQFSVNGTDTPNSTPVDLPSTFNDVFIFPYFIGNSSSATSNWELNFGSPPYSESGGNSDGNGYGNFAASVPANYYSLNTKNLAEYG